MIIVIRSNTPFHTQSINKEVYRYFRGTFLGSFSKCNIHRSMTVNSLGLNRNRCHIRICIIHNKTRIALRGPAAIVSIVLGPNILVYSRRMLVRKYHCTMSILCPSIIQTVVVICSRVILMISSCQYTICTFGKNCRWDHSCYQDNR